MLLPLERERKLAAVMIAFICFAGYPKKGYPTIRSSPSLGLDNKFSNLFFRDPRCGLNLRR